MQYVASADLLQDKIILVTGAGDGIGKETTSLDPMAAQLVGLSFCVQAGEACYVPLAHRYPGAPDQLDREAVLGRLKPWFESAERRKVGQNAKYDRHVLANHGIAVRGVVHETLLASYVLESHQRHDMDSLAMRHLGAKTILYEEVAGKGASSICFDQVGVERATEYSADDADVTFQLHGALWPRIEQDAKLRHIYADIEVPVSGVLLAMERNGVLIDSALLATQGGALGIKMLELEKRAHELAGQPFNLASPKQLGEILFGQLKLQQRAEPRGPGLACSCRTELSRTTGAESGLRTTAREGPPFLFNCLC